jgi:hypothetical protein
MRGDARSLVKQRPAPKILGGARGKLDQELFHADVTDKVHHVLDANEGNRVQRTGLGGYGFP